METPFIYIIKKVTLVVCWILFFQLSSSAQNFDWLANTRANTPETFNDFVLAKDSFIYVIGRFDTTMIFNNNRQVNSSSAFTAFVAKYSEKGQLIWVRPFIGANFSFVTSDSNNKIIVCGYTQNVFSTEIGTISRGIQILGVNNYAHFILELDTASNVLRLKDLGLRGHNWISDIVVDQKNELIISGFAYNERTFNQVKIDGVDIIRIGDLATTFLAKFNTQLQITWLTQTADCTFRELKTDKDNNIYAIGVASDTAWFDSIPIIPRNFQTGFVCKLNPQGRFVWAELFKGIDNQAVSRVECLALYDDKLYIGGDYNKTFSYKNYQPPFYSNPQSATRGYILLIDTVGNYLKTLLVNNIGNPVYSTIHKLSINKFGDLLAGGYFSRSISVSQLKASIIDNNSTSTFVLATDENLTPSWLFSIPNSSNSNELLSTNTRNAYILGSTFTNSMKFGNLSRQFPVQSVNGFLVKIQNISLRKDSLLEPAPYCAGDSISIRYSKRGTYNLGNTFYAQLSNRFGNYDSNTFIIGSRLDTASGIIRCKLPDSLRTSALYQMRLFSDSPSVNSFPDTTSYFIYAQPRADAGSDKLFCRGQAGRLINNSVADTFVWQPAELLTGEFTKEPRVSGITVPTQYIIKASIGPCNKFDTVLVNLRPPLTTTATADTTLCHDDSLVIRTVASGGRDTLFEIAWFEKINNQWQLKAFGDTFSIATANFTDEVQIAAMLNDGCTLLADTAFTTVTIRPQLDLILPTTQAICEGLPTSLQVQGFGGIDTDYVFTWRNAAGLVVSDTNSLSITSALPADSLFVIELKDGCSAPISDTLSLAISTKPNAQFTADTLQGCAPLTVQFVYTGSQSTVNTYNWQFSDGQQFFVQNPTVTFTNAGKYSVELIVNNGCLDTAFADSLITVFEVPQAAFTVSPTEAELPDAVILFENNSSNSFKYHWSLGIGQLDTAFEPRLILNDTGLYQFTLIAKSIDGCSDTASQEVRVIEVLKLELTNVFSPNGDGKNDWFGVEGTGFTLNELTIFNRWGTVVFTSKNQNARWDGNDERGNPLSAGTYFYLIEYTLRSENSRVVNGTVTLMR